MSCPRCGASPPHLPAAGEAIQCPYCHAVYQMPGAEALREPVGRAAGRPSALIALGLVAAVLLLGGLVGAVVIALHLAGGEQPVEPERATASADVAHPTSTAVSSSTRASKPAGPSTAKFDFHRKVPSLRTTFYLLGVVTNTSAHAARKPKVIAVLKDAAGKEVGTAFGYATRDVLEPGKSSPVKILVRDPPAHDRFDFEVEVKASRYAPATVTGLEVEAGAPTHSSGRSWKVEGKVHHRGSVAAAHVAVEIQALDEAGKLLGVHTAYAGSETLQPGSFSRFHTTLLLEQAPTRLEVSVSGRPAK